MAGISNAKLNTAVRSCYFVGHSLRTASGLQGMSNPSHRAEGSSYVPFHPATASETLFASPNEAVSDSLASHQLLTVSHSPSPSLSVSRCAARTALSQVQEELDAPKARLREAEVVASLPRWLPLSTSAAFCLVATTTLHATLCLDLAVQYQFVFKRFQPEWRTLPVSAL